MPSQIGKAQEGLLALHLGDHPAVPHDSPNPIALSPIRDEGDGKITAPRLERHPQPFPVAWRQAKR